ncbi:RsmE family RNA methyltransferase [Spirochaetota bacterium]
MPQYFINSSGIKDNKCVIEGDDYHHLARVRRIKKNDSIQLRDERGILINARISNITPAAIELEILDKVSNTQMPIDLNLCTCLIKGKKFDIVVQKAVEIGVNCLMPIISERTIRIPEKNIATKVNRWRRIAADAAKQCLRENLPVVKDIHSFENLIDSDYPGLKLIAHPGGEDENSDFPGESMRNYIMNNSRNAGEIDSVYLLTGPEGGFSDVELEKACKKGWLKFSFGFTQLRAETAAIAFSSIIIYEWMKIKGEVK